MYAKPPLPSARPLFHIAPLLLLIPCYLFPISKVDFASARIRGGGQEESKAITMRARAAGVERSIKVHLPAAGSVLLGGGVGLGGPVARGGVSGPVEGCLLASLFAGSLDCSTP